MKLFTSEFDEKLSWAYNLFAFLVILRVVEWFGFPVWVECALTMLIICIPAYYLHYFVEKKAWGNVALIVSAILLLAFYYSYNLIDSI